MSLETTFKIIHWYLRGGDDWDCDESYVLTDEDESSFSMLKDRPRGAHLSLTEVSVCRGKLDFTPDLIHIKREWSGLYSWLVKRYEEPERMRFVK